MVEVWKVCILCVWNHVWTYDPWNWFFSPLCWAMSQPTHTLPYAGIIIVRLPLPDLVANLFYQHNRSKYWIKKAWRFVLQFSIKQIWSKQNCFLLSAVSLISSLAYLSVSLQTWKKYEEGKAATCFAPWFIILTFVVVCSALHWWAQVKKVFKSWLQWTG